MPLLVSAPRMREINQGGDVTNRAELVKAAGFTIGMNVQRKQDKVLATITDVGNDVVTLLVGADLVTVSADSFLKGLWKEVVAKKEPEKVDWVKIAPDKSESLSQIAMKGFVAQAMLDQWGEIMKNPDQFQVMNPKNVKVSEEFAKHKLQLACATNKILFEKNEGDPSSGLQLGLTKGYRVILQPSNVFPKDEAPGQGFLNPFWVMKTSEKKDDCNMEIYGLTANRDLDSLGNDESVPLPFARNFKKVSPGESLVLFSKAAKRTDPVEKLEPAAKRHRH